MIPCRRCGKPVTSYAGDMSTLVGYSSEPGHNHDNNCRTRIFLCDDKHVTPIAVFHRCKFPGCDWVGKRTCFCHPGEKVEAPDDVPLVAVGSYTKEEQDRVMREMWER